MSKEFTGDEDLLIEEAGFCGCGDLGEAAAALAALLNTLAPDHVPAWNGEAPFSAYSQALRDAWRKVLLDHPEGVLTLLWYWIDHLEITEHGGSVPGWLTEKGQIVRYAARETATKEPTP